MVREATGMPVGDSAEFSPAAVAWVGNPPSKVGKPMYQIKQFQIYL